MVEKSLICKKSSPFICQIFYLDYGFADEDVVLSEESIKYPPLQAQKLVIEGTLNRYLRIVTRI